MTNTQSKLALYKTLVPAKYINGLKLQLQRTLLIGLSLLKTHRRKAILLSLGPSTILKLITVILPIIKILPPTIKAIKALSYFSGSGSGSSSGNNTGRAGGNNGVNAGVGTSGSMIDGVGLSMDELCEIFWTPAEEMYWERVNAMVTRFGLCKTLGITLAGVKPGRVEVIMPFRAEVSGEGGAFHASLLPTLVALTSQLTGLTLLPRHFTLKPIDFKCNILSDCDESTYLLVARGAVVVRGDHSITVKIEVLKASGLVPGSTNVVSPSANAGPSFFSWKSWVGSTSTTSTAVINNNSSNATDILVPGTGIERSQLIVCASGMQTSVIVRAGTDPLGEEEREMGRLRRERELRLRSSASSSSASLGGMSSARPSHEEEGDAIVLGDSFHNVSLPSNLVRRLSSRPMSPTSPTPSSSATTTAPAPSSSLGSGIPAAARSLDGSVYEMVSSSSGLNESKVSTEHHPTASVTTAATTSTLSYASAVRYGVEHEAQEHPLYEETSDTEAWQR